MIDIRADFKSLIGDWGLITSRPGETRCDNGALFTVEYYLCLKRHKQILPNDIDDFQNLLNQLMIQPGMTLRQPGYIAIDSPDNLIAFAIATKVFGCDFAHRILSYGKTTFPRYVLNPVNPGKFEAQAWFGRQPGLIGFLKYCSGKWVNPFEWLCLYAGIIITTRKPKEDTSDKMLTQLIVEQLPNTFIANKIKEYWFNYVKNTYGNLNNLVCIFFPGDNPFGRWWT